MCNSIKSVLFALIELNFKKKKHDESSVFTVWKHNRFSLSAEFFGRQTVFKNSR